MAGNNLNGNGNNFDGGEAESVENNLEEAANPRLVGGGGDDDAEVEEERGGGGNNSNNSNNSSGVSESWTQTEALILLRAGFPKHIDPSFSDPWLDRLTRSLSNFIQNLTSSPSSAAHNHHHQRPLHSDSMRSSSSSARSAAAAVERQQQQRRRQSLNDDPLAAISADNSSSSSDDQESDDNFPKSSAWTQTPTDPLALETERLAFDVIFYVLGRRKSSRPDPVAVTLRRSVGRMLEKYNYFFSGLISKLNVSPGMDFRRGFHEMASELFVDNEDVTWAKIIALFAFGARLAKYCYEQEIEQGESMVLDIAHNLADFAVNKLTNFIKRKGGWNSICDEFPAEEDYEDKVWRSLLVTGLSLGAIATFLAIQH